MSERVSEKISEGTSVRVKASARAWCRAAPSGASAEGSESETVLLLLVPAGVEGTTHTI